MPGGNDTIRDRIRGPGPVIWSSVGGCTLPTEQQPLRVAEFDELFATSLHQVQRRDPRRLRLVLKADAEPSARELADRESSCCTFFDFRFSREAARLVLDIRVPRRRTDVLDSLAARAEEARRRADGGAGWR